MTPRRGAQNSSASRPARPGLVHDLFLEAAVFAGEAALEHLWVELEADEGLLLRRLLRRFLHVATLPNPMLVSTSGQWTRGSPCTPPRCSEFPNWPLWLPTLKPHRHTDRALTVARFDVGQTVDLWLRATGPNYPVRAEASDLAVRLGRATIELKRQHTYGLQELAEVAWRGVLAAIADRPDEVRDHQRADGSRSGVRQRPPRRLPRRRRATPNHPERSRARRGLARRGDGASATPTRARRSVARRIRFDRLGMDRHPDGRRRSTRSAPSWPSCARPQTKPSR